MTGTVFSFILTIASIVGLVLVAIFVDDADTRMTLFAVLTPLASGGALFAARGEPMKRPKVNLDNRGYARIEVVNAIVVFSILLVFAVLLFTLGGCPSTLKAHARHKAHIDVWPKQCKLIVTADGEEKFVLTSDPTVKCAMVCPEVK